MVEGGLQPTPHSAPSLAINPEDIHDLNFDLRPVTPGRDPGIVAIAEGWGDQPSWNAAADLGTFNSPTSTAVPSHTIKLPLLAQSLIIRPS